MEFTKEDWIEEYLEALDELPWDMREKVLENNMPIVINRHLVWPDGEAELL